MDGLRSIHWARLCCVPLLYLVMIFAAATLVRAQGDNRARGDSTIRRVIFIGHLNFDCYRDTVMGWIDAEHHILPRSIHWGTARAGNDSTSDSACASATPKRSRVLVTEIRYPAWTHITGSVSFARMNDDTLADMVFLLWGTPTEQGNEAGEGREGAVVTKHAIRGRDSARVLLIPGQQGLDSIATLDLGSIGVFQSDPYSALELTEGTDVVNPAVRDVSGGKSYEMNTVHLDVKKRDNDTAGQQTPQPITAGVEALAPVSVRLFPNPASSAASVIAQSIPPGAYTIEIIAANGRTAARHELEVTSSRDLLSTFDVSELASGYYLVRLSARERLIGTYPIIVTR